MSGIASALDKPWVEAAWGLFVAANVAVLVFFPAWEAIPIHLIWVSLALGYLLRSWPVRPTVVVLAVIFVLTVEAPALGGVAAGHGTHGARRGCRSWQCCSRRSSGIPAGNWLEEARRLAEAQREFVSDTSHQLRTPITVARGHAELIRWPIPVNRPPRTQM